MDPARTAQQETQRPREPGLYETFDGTLVGESGERWTLAEMRDRPTLLLFWSSWCADCKGFLEDGMERMFAAARENGIQACLVCREGRRGETWETARECLQRMGIQEKTWMDEGGKLYDAMGLQAVPSLAILDEAGRLIAASDSMPDAEAFQAIVEQTIEGAQAQSEAFLREALMDASGAVCSSYSARRGQVVRGDSVLSETQGMLMLYAVGKNDQALFNHAYRYVRDRMTVNGLTVWRVEPGEKATVNASLDDLRILEALSLAQDAWGEYDAERSLRAAALYRSAVKDGHMRDCADVGSGKPYETVTLCYLDVAAMERLAESYPPWAQAAKNARATLEKGRISEAFPLYYPRFYPDKGVYEGERLQMNEAMVTLYHVAKAGMDCEASLDWIEDRMKEGPICAAYGLDGKPAKGYAYESTATYALIAQTALLCGRDELARMAMARVEQKRCYEPPLTGDFGAVSDAKHYTFDLMQTLLAWQAWNHS